MSYIDQLGIDPTQLDAAGSLPVSQRVITGNYLQTRDNLPLLFDREGTGTQTYSNGEVDLSVGVGEYVLCQSKSFSPYLPGKPTSIKITFSDMGHVAGLEQKVGFGSRSTSSPYTASFDGFYFGSDGTDYVIVTANSSVGAEPAILQSSWDDPLDGTGGSGLTADFTQFTVLEFDFLYLGGTALRCYINVGGERVLFHTVKWSNTKTTTIFRNPAQPVFYEVRSTTGTGGFKQICASTETQGSLELIGVNRSVNNGSTWINANNTSTTYLLKAIQLKTANRDGFVKIKTVSLLSKRNDSFLYSIILNPTIAGAAPTFTGLTNSVIEEASGASSGANTITGGTVILSEYGAQRSTFQAEANGLIRLGVNIDGTKDILALCAQPLTSNMDVYGSINTIEI